MAIGAMIRFYLVSWLGERVSADLRSAVFNNLVHMQPSYFESNHSGEIMSRLTTDTTLLQTLIGSSVSLAVRNALTLTGALTLMVITNFKLSLVILVAVPVTLVPILIFGRRVRKLSNKSQQTIAEVGSHAGEIFQSIKVVQSFNREGAEKTAFGRDVEQAFVVARSRVFQRALLTGFAIFLIMGGMVGMMWSGGVDVIEGRMTGGELGAFVFYAIMVGTAFATLSEVWGDLQRAAGAAERLMELLAETSEIPDTGSQTPASRTALAFEGVHFAHPSRPTHPALCDFTLEIAQGESVALVGPSGAGKSTVFELMLRFYDPIAGAIRFGGVDLRDMALDSWRQKIALVPQQPTLFSGDIFYNIAYGATEPTQAAVEAAAQMAPAEWPVVYGAITDDLGDHRPGQEAAREHQVLAPLLSAGFSKDDVRRYSRDAGLANAEKPSFACLSSRVPYGTAIDRELLGQIERAEAVLRAHGFLQFRVRHHDSLARIEVAAEELERAFEMREVLGRDVQAAGYKFVAIDVFGYRSGAMNALLAQPEDRSDPLS